MTASHVYRALEVSRRSGRSSSHGDARSAAVALDAHHWHATCLISFPSSDSAKALRAFPRQTPTMAGDTPFGHPRGFVWLRQSETKRAGVPGLGRTRLETPPGTGPRRGLRHLEGF